MGKFAGFLKRAKKIAGFAGGVLDGLNNIYKKVKPVANNVISSFVPFGDYINKGLDYGSKLIDKAQPITQGWLDDEDKEKVQKISDNIKRYGGDLSQKVLNNYMEQQNELFNRKGDYTLNDYAVKTGSDAFTGLLKNKGSIFGNPLN